MHGPIELLTTFRALLQTAEVTYIVSDELRIIRTNRAWAEFADANGGERIAIDWGRGASLLDAIPAPLRPFYRDGFERAFVTQKRWEHDYECSSPDVFRRYRMLVYPFGGTFIVTHSLLLACPHEDAPHPPAERYASNGVITMCSHCRRVRRGSDSKAWDWVPAYVTAMPPNVSHGLCPACNSYYYDPVEDVVELSAAPAYEVTHSSRWTDTSP